MIMVSQIVYQRPGECFGCRSKVMDLRRVYYHNQPIWVCDNCEKIVKKWEMTMKRAKKKW